MVLSRPWHAAAALAPTAAMSEVCDKARPGWDPASGPIGPIGEALHLVAGPIGLAIAIGLAVALAMRTLWIAVPFAAACVLLAAVLEAEWRGAFGISLARQAASEGCQGAPILFSMMLFSAAIAAIAASAPSR